MQTKQCDICHYSIGLYEPWYTILVRAKYLPVNNKEIKKNPMTICKYCFKAYKNFLIEREVQENHKQNYNDIIANNLK